MCEYEFKLKESIPKDGLCAKCHMSLCQKGVGKCVRCAQLIDRMVDFVFPEKGPEDVHGKR